MLLRRVQSSDPLRRFRGEMDDLFANFFGDLPGVASLREFRWRTFPAMNICEDDTHIYADIELPGMKMEDVEVSVLDNQLAVKGTIQDEQRENVDFHRRERLCGSFSRVVQLPVDIDADKVEAEMCNGVLTVTMPRAASVCPRKIEVKHG